MNSLGIAGLDSYKQSDVDFEIHAASRTTTSDVQTEVPLERSRTFGFCLLYQIPQGILLPKRSLTFPDQSMGKV
ncbi:hypothetical protein T265_12261 [Opisthorchis viverrini]|uniref:Uncharacterized protein n=1 Tax=Opisthorchis viverrini TaxID=6198 RepID=A0A074YUU9_OPIVI|nr:hypothetical protein T265_12261 [Opisthorchis viverrini]KER18478.1 hypothetical protein T265_12261 [Opisthorchis viverrini]